MCVYVCVGGVEMCKGKTEDKLNYLRNMFMVIVVEMTNPACQIETEFLLEEDYTLEVEFLPQETFIFAL